MMNTQAEMDVLRNVAQTMSDRDLEWQIRHSKRLGITGRQTQIFKDELNNRRRRYTEPAKYGNT